MRLTDLIICYLSIGAPLGAFHYFYGSSGLGRRRILRSVAHSALWPLFLTSALVERLASGEPLRKPENSKITDAYRHVGVKDLQRELELLTLGSGNELSLFAVRETIERYTELTRAVVGSGESDPELNKDLFTFGSRIPNALGPVCLSRRNYSRLRAHQVRARADVIELVFGCAPLSRRHQAMRTAQTLFAEVGDEEGVEMLKARNETSGVSEAVAAESFAVHSF